MLTIEARQNHMNTTFTLTIACDKQLVRKAQTVLLHCHREIHLLETEISEFMPSPLQLLNNSEPKTKIQMPQSFWDIWQSAEEISGLSDFAFDVFAKGKSRALVVDGKTAMRKDRDTHVGFGAIGKGYALDRVSELLHRDGFENYCLNAGGSSQVLSGMSENGPWEFAWSWMAGKGIQFSHQRLNRIALGISGTMTQHNHLIDSRLGRPTTPVVVSLVGHPSATKADALSTALFINGFDRSISQFGEMLEKPALAVIEHDSKPRWNGIFQTFWGAICTLLLSVTAFADELVDLSDVTDSNPYLTEKNFAWILLPLITLFWVFIHLKRPPQPAQLQRTQSQPAQSQPAQSQKELT